MDGYNGRSVGMVKGSISISKVWRFSINLFWGNIGSLVFLVPLVLGGQGCGISSSNKI